MALLMPGDGEVKSLGMMVNKTAPEDLKICLYTNNKTPAQADVVGDYTEMGVVQDYANKTLTGASWTVTKSDPSYAEYAQQTWTFTAGGPTSVYGYFLKLGATGTLMWAELFTDGPYVVQNAGDQIKVTPKITMQ